MTSPPFYGILYRNTSPGAFDPVVSAQDHMDEAEELLFEKYLALPQKARDAIIKMMHSLNEAKTD